MTAFIKAFLLIFLLQSVLIGCKPSYLAFRSEYENNAAGKTESAPDYGDLFYWAAHPGKKDPSDSVPAPFIKQITEPVADVFFIHPTTLTDPALSGVVWNASFNDAALNLKTDFTSMLYQASVFNESCRVFAPRYRQAHIHSFSPTDSLRAMEAFELAYADIREAFLYYLQKENRNRPIILASHSQGTLHARRLMKEFFDGTALQKQLVCAYLLGLYVPEDAFQQVRVCTNDSSVGCVVGWRTYRKGYIPPFIQREVKRSVVVNPLTWTVDTEKADRKLNQAAVLFKFNHPYHYTNGAQVHENVLWIEKPRFPFSFLDRRKNYHPGDINLFYLNIRMNVQKRIREWEIQTKNPNSSR